MGVKKLCFALQKMFVPRFQDWSINPILASISITNGGEFDVEGWKEAATKQQKVKKIYPSTH